MWIEDKPIASLSAVRHSAHFAFLGLFIVKPKYRGMGYGKLLWDVTLDSLKNCSTIGLNGILNQVNMYANSGFKRHTLNIRWRGKLSKEWLKFSRGSTEREIVLATDVPLTKIIDYDSRIFSIPRAAFLSKWLTMPKAHALCVIENNILRGYGVISLAEEGYKIAPLFADNEEIAECLYVALCQRVDPNAFIYLDTNENNPSAAALARSFNLEKIFETLRMYKGEAPKSDDKRIFGLTSLEIG